jgi:carbonic anhydrase/acetyltransferase-like protein (isoleucine patch superfamily)
MTIEKYLDHSPKIDEKTYVADSAVIMGMVEIGECCSVWPNVTMRGDVNYIKMGKFSNVQDNSVVHVAAQPCPTIIGDYVTIGHSATVHACIIEDNCLIGMGSVILDGAIIGHGSIIGAGAVVPPGKVIPPFSKVMGIPGKVVAQLTPEDEQGTIRHSRRYWNLAADYVKGGDAYKVEEPKVPMETGEAYKKYL